MTDTEKLLALEIQKLKNRVDELEARTPVVNINIHQKEVSVQDLLKILDKNTYGIRRPEMRFAP